MNKVMVMVLMAAATVVAGELSAELKLGLGEKEVAALGARMNDPKGPDGWRLACVEIDTDSGLAYRYRLDWWKLAFSKAEALNLLRDRQRALEKEWGRPDVDKLGPGPLPERFSVHWFVKGSEVVRTLAYEKKGNAFALALDICDNTLSAKCESRKSTRKTYLAEREQQSK